MKHSKLAILSFATFSLTAAIFAFADKVDAADMHRLYNPNSGEHFYTANTGEKNNLVDVGWKYEDFGWTAPDSGNPVYRLYNKNAGDHHYTLDGNEKNHLVSVGWNYEGIGWYSDTKKSVPLFRAYNPNATAGSHNYTVNGAEQQMLLRAGWKDEGIAWYGINKTTSAPTPPKPTPVTKYTVTIKHMGSDGKELKKSTALVEKGQPYTAKAETFSEYTLKGANSQKITVNGNATITFTYTKNSMPPTPVTEYTVTTRHVGSDGKELKKSTASVEKGKQYTAKAETFADYTLSGNNSQTITVNNNQTITFNYTKNPDPITKFNVTINAICNGQVIKTKAEAEAVEKGKVYTATAEHIDGYKLIEQNTKQVTVNADTTIDFRYEKVELVDIFNLKVYVDGVYYTTIVKIIKKGESYQPSTYNLGLDENIYDIYAAVGVTYPEKSWVGGQIYNYEFDVHTYKPLQNIEAQNFRNTMLAKVNELRAQNGRNPVEMTGALNHAAGIRSNELDIDFAHTRPNGSGFQTILDETPINYTSAGENIASNNTRERDGNRLADQVFTQWLNSPGHKATMLNSRYTHFGIGVYLNKNEVYATQLFVY